MEISNTLVQVDSVFKYYGLGSQRVSALENIHLNVTAGEFLALSGPSGSGKTTLLNLIGALDRQDSGTISILGQAIGAMNSDQMTLLRRHTIGFIFQSYNLIPVMTVLENAAFVLSLQKLDKVTCLDRAREALALVGLSGMENRFPNQMSGGQQQRVAVARALAARPALLLADEPTANLDSKNAEELLDTMESLNQDHGITFVFSTHDHRIMKRAKRVVSMKDGRVISGNTKHEG